MQKKLALCIAYVLLLFFISISDLRSEDKSIRIYFRDDPPTPVQSGPEGEQNSKNFRRIAESLKRLENLPNVDLIFLAPRRTLCLKADGCDPNQLMSQMFSNTITILKKVMSGRRFEFQKIRWMFAENVETGSPSFGSDQTRSGRFLEAWLQISSHQSSSCPWTIFLNDPVLPPILGGRINEPAIPLGDGQNVLASDNARISISSVSQPETEGASVWENDRGEFRLGPKSSLSNRGSMIPSVGKVTLYILDSSSAEVQNFLARLDDKFRTALNVPKTLRRQTTRNYRTLGAEDYITSPPDKFLPPASTNLQICRVFFNTTP